MYVYVLTIHKATSIKEKEYTTLQLNNTIKLPKSPPKQYQKPIWKSKFEGAMNPTHRMETLILIIFDSLLA